MLVNVASSPSENPYVFELEEDGRLMLCDLGTVFPYITRLTWKEDGMTRAAKLRDEGFKTTWSTNIKYIAGSDTFLAERSPNVLVAELSTNVNEISSFALEQPDVNHKACSSSIIEAVKSSFDIVENEELQGECESNTLEDVENDELPRESHVIDEIAVDEQDVDEQVGGDIDCDVMLYSSDDFVKFFKNNMEEEIFSKLNNMEKALLTSGTLPKDRHGKIEARKIRCVKESITRLVNGVIHDHYGYPGVPNQAIWTKIRDEVLIEEIPLIFSKNNPGEIYTCNGIEVQVPVDKCGPSFQNWPKCAKSMFTPRDVQEEYVSNSSKKKGRKPYRKGVNNDLYYSEESIEEIDKLHMIDEEYSFHQRETVFKNTRRTLQSQFHSKSGGGIIGDNPILIHFFDSHLHIVKQFDWLYSGKTENLEEKVNKSFPKFIQVAEKYLLKKKMRVEEGLLQEQKYIKIIEKLNLDMDGKRMFIIENVDDILQLPDCKGGNCLFLHYDKKKFAVFFEKRKLIENLNILQALLFYFAFTYVTLAKYHPGSRIVSVLLGMKLFGIVEDIERDLKTRKKIGQFLVFENQSMATMMG